MRKEQQTGSVRIIGSIERVERPVYFTDLRQRVPNPGKVRRRELIELETSEDFASRIESSESCIQRSNGWMRADVGTD